MVTCGDNRGKELFRPFDDRTMTVEFNNTFDMFASIELSCNSSSITDDNKFQNLSGASNDESHIVNLSSDRCV
ncbi:hypothetical protein VIGAN_03244800 [Vigna angularis var. angularis]|uniref:Uncharacterized protein n=1 Tax=Vigna angularis var. angularis TaxID=157739 RepID=A0A0S3RP99_PHAAN|nr:hypothetical protein VIGAN_03244800 [Vigna angularis var. angularis]